MSKRRIRHAAMAVAVMVALPVLGGCQVGAQYGNHGFPVCYLQIGPELPPPHLTEMHPFPILGDALWEACYLLD